MKLTNSLNFQSKKHKISARLLSLIAVLLLTGCGPTQEQISCSKPESQAETNSAELKQSKSIQLSVFIDGTPSMQGYVSSGLSSRYSETLRLIDSASSTGWSNTGKNVKYYRFGTKKQLIDRDTYLKAQLPLFYQGGADFSVSRIDSVLSNPTPESLSAIVTDLYQKDADVRLVQNQLVQQYLEKGYAIGVLAIKSEFKGTIYDVGLAGQSFQYSTVRKSSQFFHPFYVIILGHYGNINHFFDQLIRNGLKSVEHQFEIFYPQPIQKAAMLDSKGIGPSLRKDIMQPKSLNDGQVVVRKKTSEEAVQFLAITQKTQNNPIPVEIPYWTLEHVLPLEPTSITVKTVAEQFQRKTKEFQPVNTEGFQLTNWQLDSQSIRAQAKFQSEQLDKGVYRFTFEAFPTDLVEPEWWNIWNTPEGSFSGHKTNNLLPFLRGLRLSTTEQMKQRKPLIARLCYAIQKK